MLSSRILLMSTLAFTSLANAGMPNPEASAAAIELDGSRARALDVAFDAFRDKLPDAVVERYSVHVHAAQDGVIQVVFEPRLAPDEKPTLGGRTSAGRELNVWVKTDGYVVDRTAFAR